MVKRESDYVDWQKEAKINEEATAERAYTDSMRLLRDGEEVTLKSWASDIINEMYGMCEVLGIDEDHTLKLMLGRISNPDLTYGKRMLKLIERDGYINTHMTLSKNNKINSINRMENMDSDELESLQEYIEIALSGLMCM